MQTLKLIYPKSKTQQYKESITMSASIELYTQHGMDSYQSSATTLVFDTERACVFASIALSSNPLYTVEIVQQKTL